MSKSKIFKTLITALLSSILVFSTGCFSAQVPNNNEEEHMENTFFSAVTISQANGDFSYQPTINASPSDDVEIPLLSGDIYTVCKKYKKYITDKYNAEGIDVFAPTPLTISWESEETPEYYILNLSTNEDLSDAEMYVTFKNSVTLNYLFMGYSYYYQIEAKFEDRVVKSRIFEFKTAYLPRTVYVDDNVSNTRDWGGYLCEDGIHRVKQGIVYRGGKLEDITQSGKDVMLINLGIKTDLDVRGDGTAGTATSPLGASVNYIETTGPYYIGTTGIDFDGDLTAEKQAYKEALITEIRAFANPDNFPIYVHCSLGRDRTGTICFLINALLGVGQNDLFRDYEISMMSAAGHADNQTAAHMVGNAFAGLYNYIYYRTGKTLAEKTEAYMLSIGITAEEIAAIKANMLEEVK